MATVSWTELAESELEEIVHFIGVLRRRPETALRLYFEIRQAVDDHGHRSKRGHTHLELPATWRYFKFKRWIIAYEMANEAMIVQRIVDLSRDLSEVFGSDQ